VNNTARRAKITVSADGKGLVSQAGMLLLAEAARVTGLRGGLSGGLARWRSPRAAHDPGKILTDLVMALALGGDCLADVAVLRAEPELAGPVASGPVVSRLVSARAADSPRALRAIRKARAAARERAWALAGNGAPGAGGNLIPDDIDATIVPAHPEKERPPLPGRRRKDSIPSPRSPTTVPGRAGRPWPSCCALATRDPTPQRSTSR
jgi:Transposase DDE domain group 1